MGSNVESEQALSISLGGEWYILAGGLSATAFVIAFGAYSKARANLKFTDIISIVISAGDAFTDLAFTVQQLSKMQNRTEYVFALLLLFFLVVPAAGAAYQVVQALRSPCLETGKLQDLAAYYALVLLVALTNMEVLRVLPWREGTAIFDGLPDRSLMVRVWLTVMLLEDIPQFCLQLTLTLTANTGPLAPLSLGFTMTAVVWRALRKAIYLVPAASSPHAVLSINSRVEWAEGGAAIGPAPELSFPKNSWSWSARRRARGHSSFPASSKPVPMDHCEAATWAATVASVQGQVAASPVLQASLETT